MVKIVLDEEDKETSDLSAAGKSGDRATGYNSWKVRLPQFLQPNFDVLLKVIFVYLCIFIILSFIVLGLSIAGLAEASSWSGFSTVAVVVLALAFLVIVRVLHAAYTGSIYPRYPQLLSMIILDLLIFICFGIVTVLAVVNILSGYGLLSHLFLFAWAELAWLPLLVILILTRKQLFQVLANLHRAFVVKIREHITFE